MTTSAAEAAAVAENAVRDRHLRPFGPGASLGVVSWPAVWWHRSWLEWHYWWQAHLLDCLIDAQLRDPGTDRLRAIERLLRGIRRRNLGRWTNRFHDDMAWLGLATQRLDQLGLGRHPAVAVLTRSLDAGWVDRRLDAMGGVVTIGGLPWHRGSDFSNAPATGPAAILLARAGHLERAVAMADWLHTVLTDPDTGLVFDGIRPGSGLVRRHYTYCQGVVLGLDLELARRTGQPRFAHRVVDLVAAVEDRLCRRDGVILGEGGGDGGLFNAILARYLGLVATDLPGADEPVRSTRERSARIVRASAAACWDHRYIGGDGFAGRHGPVFGPDWTRPAVDPSPRPGTDPSHARVGRRTRGATASSAVAERDLSVQLNGWMVLETAARLDRAATGQPAAGA